MESIRQKAVSGIKKGDRFRVTRTFDESDMLRFAEVSRDYNPVHFDERFSRSRGFTGRICHGLLVGSILTEIGGQIGWLATAMSFEFKRPVYLNQTVTCELEITCSDEKGRAEAEAVFTDEKKEVVIRARLSGFLPADPQKKIMKTMLAEGDPTNRCLRTKG